MINQHINLFELVITFVKMGDAGLVDNRSCFPCKKHEHPKFKEFRDIVAGIADSYDPAASEAFSIQVEGRGDNYKAMLAKSLRSAVKRNKLLIEVFDALAEFENSSLSLLLVSSEQRAVLASFSVRYDIAYVQCGSPDH